MNEETNIQVMQANKQLSNAGEVENFMEALTALRVDKSNLYNVLLLFSDKAKFKDPLKILANRIAKIDTEIFVAILVESTPELLSSARDWLITFYASILIDRKTVGYVKSILLNLPLNKQEEVKELLHELGSIGFDDEELDEILHENLTYLSS
jgi:hypothetical protein